MSARTRGAAFVGAGVVLFAVTIVVSAAVAPAPPTADGATGTGNGTADGPLTLVGSQGGGTGLHDHGSVYLLSGDDVAWRAAGAGSYFDATMLDNGSVVAGFMSGGYADCGRYDAPCARTGFRVIDPTPTPHVVSEFSFPVRTRKNSEVHDVEPLPSGGYVFTDMDAERIAVVRNGSIAWQWNASSFYDAPADPTRTDWLHINDVDRIGDGRYLVSVRNANQLLIVERGAGVVEVINEDESPDDGARTGDADVLNHQHNPQWLGDGAVLVADSENNRVVELHRTDDGDWRVAWRLNGAGGRQFRWPRDADRLPNGNTLITDSLGERIVEVNRDGEVVWSYRTPYVPYEADRLPAGETVGAASYEGGGGDPVGIRVPLLTPAVIGLHATFPWLPRWIAEPQIAVTVVSAALALAGVGLLLFGRVRGRE